MLENSTPRIERVLFRNNRAEVAGGGLYWTVSGPDMVLPHPQNKSPEHSPPQNESSLVSAHSQNTAERLNLRPREVLSLLL
jgi:predicted outer membrane repeat protein